MGFRDEHRFNGTPPYIQQPLSRAIDGSFVADHLGHLHHRLAGKILAQGAGQVAHRLEVIRPTLMDPAHHLSRAKRLLADFRKETGKPLGIKVEKIDGH